MSRTKVRRLNTLTENHLREDIQNFVEVNYSASPTEKGDKFTEWILKYIFEREDEEIEEDMQLSGCGDNSIDAWFDDGLNLHIIQTKYNTAHRRGGFTEFCSDLDRLLHDPYSVVGNKQDFEDFSLTLNSYLQKEDEDGEKLNINLHYFTTSHLTDEFLMRFYHDKEQLEQKFENVTLNVYGIKEIYEYILMSLEALPKQYIESDKKLLLKNWFITGETCVAEVELKHFAKFVKDNIDYLFFSNIRNYLGDTVINKEIKETFQQTPTDFWYYNNGITIICDDFDENFLEVTQSKVLKIKAPQIVNGCQTSNAIYQGFKTLNPDQQKHLNGCILVKIIKDSNRNRVKDIIKYTNRQNTVSAMDFFALDNFHQNLKKQFLFLGYQYEIQRKEARFASKKEKAKFGTTPENKPYSYLFPPNFNYKLPVKQVVTAYAAGMHYMPGTANSRAGDLAPGKKTSKEIFNDQTTPKNPLYFLFPFAVLNYAKYSLKYGAVRKKKEELSNNRARGTNIDFRKNCLMLFVAVYFRLIVRLMKAIKQYNNHENDNPLLIDIEVYDLIFKNKEINETLLTATDTVIYDFINDRSVKELIKDNLPKFLKTDVQKNEQAIDILIEKIENVISSETSIPDKVYTDFESLVNNHYLQHN